MKIVKNSTMASFFEHQELSMWVPLMDIQYPKGITQLKKAFRGFVNQPWWFCFLPDGNDGISAISDDLWVFGGSFIVNYGSTKNPEFFVGLSAFVAKKDMDGKNWILIKDDPVIQQSVSTFYFTKSKIPYSDLKENPSKMKNLSAKIRNIIKRAANSDNPLKFLHDMMWNWR